MLYVNVLPLSEIGCFLSCHHLFINRRNTPCTCLVADGFLNLQSQVILYFIYFAQHLTETSSSFVTVKICGLKPNAGFVHRQQYKFMIRPSILTSPRSEFKFCGVLPHQLAVTVYVALPTKFAISSANISLLHLTSGRLPRFHSPGICLPAALRMTRRHCVCHRQAAALGASDCRLRHGIRRRRTSKIV